MSFLQVKRKFKQEPNDILLVASKKIKIKDLNDAVIFEFSGTADSKEDIKNVISSIQQHQIKNNANNRTVDKIREKFRVQHLKQCKSSRLSLVNCLRKLDDESATESSVTILNINNDDDESGCVYDVYYSPDVIDTNDPQFNEHYYAQQINWKCYLEEEHYDVSEDEHPDEEDSNDENYYGNEYPDEEDSDATSYNEFDYSDATSYNETDYSNATDSELELRLNNLQFFDESYGS